MKIILASKSPRRQELIKGLELDYSILTYEVDESFEWAKPEEIASKLALKKSNHCPKEIVEDEILLTADTIVWVNNKVLNKPENKEEAMKMLNTICGTTHEVYTGVCLRSKDKTIHFSERTEVTCKSLNQEEMTHYIDQYQPYDKAGSYGIQDWFGYTSVERINGCFYNVMGLPVSKIYQVLKKEFGLTLLLLFTCAFAFGQQRTVVQGLMPSKKGQAMLQYFISPYDNDPSNFNFEIPETGDFKAVLQIEEGQMIAFVDEKSFFRFYIKPGDSLILNTDPKNNNKVVFEGKGQKEALYGYKHFEHFKESTESIEFQKTIGTQMTSRSPDGFKAWADSIVTEKMKFLNANASLLSKDIKQQLEADYFYEFENLKLTYPQYYQNRRNSNAQLPPLESSFYSFLNQANLNQLKIMNSGHYRTFQKLNLIKYINDRGQRLSVMDIWKLADTLFNGEVLSLFRLQLWAEIVYNGQINDATQLYPIAKKECGKFNGFSRIEAAYKDKLPFEIGSKAYDFAIKNQEGKTVKLSDFKGKVVYIDFWASWCRPCLGEIPAGEEVKKYFEGKDVVFLNISIDEGEQNWLAARSRYTISGLHLLCNNQNSPEVQKKYKVESIPSYFIIDKEGNYFSAPAPRPSNPTIYKLIEEAIAK